MIPLKTAKLVPICATFSIKLVFPLLGAPITAYIWISIVTFIIIIILLFMYYYFAGDFFQLWFFFEKCFSRQYYKQYQRGVLSQLYILVYCCCKWARWTLTSWGRRSSRNSSPDDVTMMGSVVGGVLGGETGGNFLGRGFLQKKKN